MRLYYFVEARWAVENIAKRRIKVCRFSELNDPFVLLAADLINRQHRVTMKRWAKALDEQFGVLCFTTGWTDPLMWSHYGDRHRGICLGFQVDESILKKVNYSPKRLTLVSRGSENHSTPPELVKDLLLTTKFARWKYEAEVRVVESLTHLTQENRLFFRRFDKSLKLVQVISGHRCCVDWKSKIETAIGTLPQPVDLIKARLAFRKFRVTHQKWGFNDTRAWQPHSHQS